MDTDSARDEGIALWNLWGKEDLPQDKGSQTAWEEAFLEFTFNRLLNNASTQDDKARLLAAQVKESGAWLHALPSPQLGLHLCSGCC
jgi:hypothetical protein